ncbi:hypothetical protein LTR16_001480 [Cryomyces antarcticus]|uniref:Uncharacterized protein n=1 Tax=Cryomyces antarcticus TaxID=329879 RepID=A0ABR0KUZ4_9PEZI|nr:hypothetical protein LTR39_000936 [Cryomyces antarcticus]KAK5020151.1 hypothetical protein LTR60_000786 [Cryomyces antarcticus]KAK5130513.1 hypothetical protein LTR16_001480 [Cryomyces antarcticus]
MALENITLADLVLIDKTYLSRIKFRRQLIASHPLAVMAVNPRADEAVREMYEWVVGTYLPKRYPTMFRTFPAAEKAERVLRNLVTNEDIPLRPSTALSALRTLGEHVDDDFLFLLPESAPSAPDAQPRYRLEAFMTCFPSGFSTLKKLNGTLAAIHAPVPGYPAKLERSMDRFFTNLPVGKAVKRANWTITTTDALFSQAGTHLYSGSSPGSPDADAANAKTLALDSPGLAEQIAVQRAAVSVPDCRLRCERQTLHRLPKSGAVVFAFKTYQYRLEDVKAEGSGEDLALAIEGFAKGSVPQMELYKRGVVWGDKVREYLRS